ncbi:MAG: NUDIX domain-containing protein [Gammaproteobacteria bacterium]|nr:NUDIX domain-containing protein [Gammaproteobacteria bacterium]
MKYCSECGDRLVTHQLAADAREYDYCIRCAEPRIDHPSVMLTCFLSCGQKLLWIQRKLEPRSGFWAIPGGFMERGETVAAGTARELWEETGIRLAPAALEFYMTGTITFINQVYICFRASVASEDCQPGQEAIAAAFFSREECPWDEVAYPEVNDSIRRAYDDLERGSFGLYQAEMTQEIYRLLPISTVGYSRV